MESVLVAVILIFILLFGALTLGGAFLSSQDILQTAWTELEDRLADQSRTTLTPISGRVADAGTTIVLTYRNTGANKAADFDQWDVIVQYYDFNTPARQHIQWLPFNRLSPMSSEWAVSGIFQDAASAKAEAYEPGVLNPGEEIVLAAKVGSPVGVGAPVQAIVALGNGSSAALIFSRNVPPTVTVNAGLTVGSGGARAISAARLLAEDADNKPFELTYTITTPPAQGSLSFGATFTQADINAGLLTYMHTGTGDDGFAFTVSDGQDTTTTHVFPISISQPPALMTNSGLTTTTAGGPITSAELLFTDQDDAPENLIFVVVNPPALGSLSLGAIFTQADIANGLLVYSPTSTGSDSFSFTVSDGETTIGAYTFNITVS